MGKDELARQAAALYAAANAAVNASLSNPAGLLMADPAALLLGRQLRRFRAFMDGAAPELRRIVEQMAAGDDLAAQLQAMPAELEQLAAGDDPAQLGLFPGVTAPALPDAPIAHAKGFGLSLKQAGRGKRGGR